MNQTTYPSNNLMFEQWKEIQNQIHNDNRNNDFPMPNVQNVILIFIQILSKISLYVLSYSKILESQDLLSTIQCST